MYCRPAAKSATIAASCSASLLAPMFSCFGVLRCTRTRRNSRDISTGASQAAGGWTCGHEGGGRQERTRSVFAIPLPARPPALAA